MLLKSAVSYWEVQKIEGVTVLDANSSVLAQDW